MPSKYVIEGKVPLKGAVTISGAKNAAIKEIFATLLTTEEVRLENVPSIGDVETDLEIAKALGIQVQKGEEGVLTLKGAATLRTRVPEVLAVRTRGAILALGPLLAREGRATIPTPGGCAIGERPLDRHIFALQALGARVRQEKGKLIATARPLKGGRVLFKKNTVMGTENAILAAVLAVGESEIGGAAQEPEVDDLITLLQEMGAKIHRDAANPSVILIQGVQTLKGAMHKVIPDRIEAVTFAVATALTRGDVQIQGMEGVNLTAFLAKLGKIGVSFEIGKGTLHVWASPEDQFVPVEVETAPHPGFATDWQPILAVLLTQANGVSLLHETVYEDRFRYLPQLRKFGAAMELLTPSQAGREFRAESYNFDWPANGSEPAVFVRVNGPTPLKGAKAEIPDLRAGAALVLAALAAEGRSEILGVEHIERGYERFEEKLAALGARIQKVEA